MKKMKRKIAFLLVTTMLLGMSLTAHAAEQQIAGTEVGAKLYRFLATENNQNAVTKGKTTTILAVSDMVYDREKYEYVNDEHHVYTVLATNFTLTGNTSPDTKLILNDILHNPSNGSSGFFESFQLQVGADETAEELTVSCNIGFWGYYLKNKETGEIFRVTGDDQNEIRLLTVKVKDEIDDFGFQRSIVTADHLPPGWTAAVYMKFDAVYDKEKYELCADAEHPITPGLTACTVSGNTCSKTQIEDRGDYLNVRYLIVDEEEKAEELTIRMICERWAYYVKDKATNEIFSVYGGEFQPEILTKTVKIGGNPNSDTSESDAASSPTTENSSSQQPPAEARPANEVTSSNGEKQISTIGGVYKADNVSGIAVLTPKEQVETASGIDNAGENTNIRFYVCNGQNTDAKKALEETAAQSGKKVHTVIQMDMYAINKEGKVDKINRTLTPIRIIIGLPEQYRNPGKTYTIGMLGEDGTLHLLQDLDNDPTTVTIETDRFGIMALME